MKIRINDHYKITTSHDTSKAISILPQNILYHVNRMPGISVPCICKTYIPDFPHNRFDYPSEVATFLSKEHEDYWSGTCNIVEELIDTGQLLFIDGRLYNKDLNSVVGVKEA